jgi:hypothetical protein
MFRNDSHSAAQNQQMQKLLLFSIGCLYKISTRMSQQPGRFQGNAQTLSEMKFIKYLK